MELEPEPKPSLLKWNDIKKLMNMAPVLEEEPESARTGGGRGRGASWEAKESIGLTRR